MQSRAGISLRQETAGRSVIKRVSPSSLPSPLGEGTPLSRSLVVHHSVTQSSVRVVRVWLNKISAAGVSAGLGDVLHHLGQFFDVLCPFESFLTLDEPRSVTRGERL